jgi:hypothetical protein
MALSITAMEEGFEKELEVMQFHFEQMLRTFAFFSGFPVETLRASEYLDDMANIYYASIAQLFEEEENIQLQQVFIWQGEEWYLHAPELKHGSKMTTAEYVDAKQMLLNMQQLGKGKWESLLPLCAVYLRRKEEQYEESFLYEGSERMDMMLNLPMDIALQVGFFSALSMNICINTLPSSNQTGSRVPAGGVKSIMNAMAGSTS